MALTSKQKDKIGISRKRALVGIERNCQRKVEGVLRSIGKECAGRVAAKVAPVADGAEARWAAQFRKAEAPSGVAAASVGENTARTILRAGAQGKAATPQDPGEVGIGAGDDFLLPASRKSVTGYFMFTSKRQAGTCATKVNDVFAAVRDAKDKDGNALGLDPKRIARELLKQFNDWSKPYARMIARTGSIYAMNAGAQARYQEAGVERQEWWATEDDLTCPYCLEQHEKTVAIGDAFASNDKPATRADGKPGTLSLPGASGAIEFPPLHPNCRCTIVPVIDEAALLAEEDEPALDGEPGSMIEPDGSITTVAVIQDIISTDPGADAGFVKMITDEANDKIPKNVAEAFKKDGVTIKIANRLTDAYPDLANKHPQNWPKGMTWEHAEGVHMKELRHVVIAKQHRNYFRTDKSWEDGTRPLGVLAHETGHAVHDAIMRRDPKFRDEIQTKWAKAVKRIERDSTVDAELLAYYMHDAKDAGLKEVMAEAYAVEFHADGAGSKLQRSLLKQYFGDVFSMVSTAVRGLTP